MSIFVSGSDETSGKDRNGTYTYGGWVANERYWDRVFVPELDRRVLSGSPRIPYLHMTDIRSPKWRADKGNGISRDEGERRVEQAVHVIDKMRGLFPITVSLSGAEFDQKIKAVARQHRIERKETAAALNVPDCICFLYYAMRVLHYVKVKHPDAHKVNFVVERNTEITNHLKF